MTRPKPGRYAVSAINYFDAGWFPIPLAGKRPLVSGRHGDKPFPDRTEVEGWVSTFPATNVGLRLPDGILGIDVDCYDGKPGAATLSDAERRWGKLPLTWVSTARTDGSGIRMFRVPEGSDWPGKLDGGGVEIIHSRNRFVVAAPSIHRTGKPYRWIGPDGQDGQNDEIPEPADLPRLPPKWAGGLKLGAYEARPVADLTTEQAREWLGGRNGEPCPYLERVTARATTWFAEHGEDGAYDHMNNLAWGLARDAHDGHPGVALAALAIQRAYVAEVAKRRGSKKTAEEEWKRSLAGAVRKVAAEPDEAGGEDPCDLYKRWAPTIVGDGGGAVVERFEFLTAGDLAKPVPPMRWLVRGVWPENSHGVLAGEKKTLKSWNALALAVAIASGKPYLGKFDVEKTGPVLIFSGEGGDRTFMSRYQRVCEAYGVQPAGLPVSATVGVGPLDGSAFRNALASKLDKFQPVLVILDPLYVYHPAKVEAQNLYERGRMLGRLSTDVGHETALVVGDHYRKQSGRLVLDLDEVGQSGVAQWADSWILQGHRRPPDLVAGSFQLGVSFGSRQASGSLWDIDWSLPFDHDLGEPSGPISWTVEPSSGATGSPGKLGHDDLQNLVSAWIGEHEPTTRAKVCAAVTKENRVGDRRVKAAFDELDRTNLIRSEAKKVREGARSVEREVWVAGDGRVQPRSEPRSADRKIRK